MSKFRFVNIIDTFFIYSATALIIFAWLQFFIKNIIFSLIISLILSVAIIYTLHHLKAKKQLNISNQVNKTAEMLKLKLTIQTMPVRKVLTFICKLIPSQYTCRIVKDNITFIRDGSTRLFTTYFNSELTEPALLEIIKNRQSDHITVFCISFNSELKSLCKTFKNKYIQLIDFEQLYNLFAQNNISIDTSNIDLSKHKITVKEILKGAVARNKSKGYFISGLVILFTSIIIPYKIYYVVFSTILFTLSLVCRLKPATQNRNTTIID